jgi:hypothetical protein
MTKGRRIAAKAKRVKGIVQKQHFAQTGLTNRIYGHIASYGRRAQGRKDTRGVEE